MSVKLSKASAVREWRRNTKLKCVQGMGSCCQICGYDKCHGALEFHHVDPTEKSFAISQHIANPASWTKIAAEMKKCILLCANCHREVGLGVTPTPDSYQEFDESLIETALLKKVPEKVAKKCPVCGGDTYEPNTTCSLSCAGILRRRVTWDQVDLEALLEEHNGNKTKVGEILGISGGAVGKRLKKIRK